MPEGFTHVTLAHRAAEQVGWNVTSDAAFAAGANGPDVLFSFEGWKPAAKRRYNLKGLGNQMHHECTGAFLAALCQEAKTPSQLDYFMGFVAHYAIDTTMHPYVTAVTQKKQPYHRRNGHGHFEIALDSYLCQKETGNADFGIDSFAPPLVGMPLAEVSGQLDRALSKVYDVDDLPHECLVDAFHDNRRIRSIFSSRFGIKRALFWLVEPFFGGYGTLTIHVHPRPLKGVRDAEIAKGKGLPNPWTDAVTGEVHEETLDQLIERAVARTVEIYTALLDAAHPERIAIVMGSFDYETGTETEESTADMI